MDQGLKLCFSQAVGSVAVLDRCRPEAAAAVGAGHVGCVGVVVVDLERNACEGSSRVCKGPQCEGATHGRQPLRGLQRLTVALEDA